MPAATAPMRVPPRSRGSVSTASGHAAQSPTDEICHLTLPEVRDRLARNERVLNSALFSTSPGMNAANTMNPSAMSPGAMNGAAGPSRASASEDPVRARLLAVRAQLCAREAELLADSMGGMDLAERASPASPPTRSAKAMAFDAIRQEEAAHPRSHMTLPIDSTLALGERDFENQWSSLFASVGIGSGASSRAPSGQGYPREGDAPERAWRVPRANDNNMFDTDDAAAAQYASQRYDVRKELHLAEQRARRQAEYDDDMRSDEGSHGDDWCEGNDEYEGDGRDSMDAAPG